MKQFLPKAKNTYSCFFSFIPCAYSQNDHLKLWHNKPAGEVWEAALPVDNGRIGASITKGATLEHPKQESYPALLQLKHGGKYAVTNYGVSGTAMVKKENLSYAYFAQSNIDG